MIESEKKSNRKYIYIIYIHIINTYPYNHLVLSAYIIKSFMLIISSWRKDFCNCVRPEEIHKQRRRTLTRRLGMLDGKRRGDAMEEGGFLSVCGEKKLIKAASAAYLVSSSFHRPTPALAPLKNGNYVCPDANERRGNTALGCLSLSLFLFPPSKQEVAVTQPD